MADAALGSTERTNQLLQEASKVTGLPAPVFSVDRITNPEKPIDVPKPPVDNTNYNSMIAGGNAMVSGLTAPNTQTDTIPDYLKKYLEAAPPTNPTDTYNSLYNQSGIDEKQKLVNESTNRINALKAQLQGITAEQTADSLKLKGEGISAGAIRGRDINLERESAIRSLPIQAQIIAENAVLTGNNALLEQAQGKLKQVFDIQTQYQTDLFNYNQKLRDAVYSYADKQQQAKLDAQKVQDQNNFTTMTNNLNQAQNWATTAIANGQGALAGQIMALDPKAPGYQVKLSALAAQLEQKLPATASIQEYEYAKKNGYKGTYEQYQDQDANRKVAIQNGSGLSGPQLTAFNSLADKQNKSPLVAAADRTIVLKNSIEQARKDPKNAAQQLSLIYSYIQALDTYQSAVREGELGLVNSIDSKIGQFQSSIQKIQNGQIVRPEVILQIADAAKNVVDTIQQGADLKKKQFKAQANVQGLGDVWEKYMNGAGNSFEQGPAPTGDNMWNW